MLRSGYTAHIPHLGVEVQILIKMALINEKPVNAELFKADDRILTLGVVELFELRLDCLSGFISCLTVNCSPLEACTSSMPRSISSSVVSSMMFCITVESVMGISSGLL